MAVTSDLLTNVLKTSSAISAGSLEKVWLQLLTGPIFFKLSLYAAGFGAWMLAYWSYNYYTNKKLQEDAVAGPVGSIAQYLVLGFMMSLLAAPAQSGQLLYGLHDFQHKTTDDFVEAIAAINGDPNAAFANLVLAQQVVTNGQRACDTVPQGPVKQQCYKDLANNVHAAADPSNQGGGWTENVKNAIDGLIFVSNIPLGIATDALKAGGIIPGSPTAGKVFNFIGNTDVMIFLTPVLLLIGTAFLVVLEVGQLMAAFLFPIVLLIGIGTPGYVKHWAKSFFSWGLILFSYKAIVSSVAYIMLDANILDTGVYALVAGFFAPIIAYQVVSGSTLGLMGAVGSAVGTVGARIR